MKKNIYIGLTYGDPASIGPEILLKTLKHWKFRFKPIVIGLKEALIKNKKVTPGKPSKYTGRHSYKCLKEVVSLAKEKKIAALVTGPVSKKAIEQAGIHFSGQTDAMAKMCKIDPKNVIMLFAANDLRIALFTRHIPLKTVNSQISKIKLEGFLLLLNKELKKWFHIKNPKIGILGLNPHAGESGLFGTEEKKIIMPVVKNLYSRGLKVFGPLSPDATLAKAGQDFLKKRKQSYDTYVSFYHDQALPMFKAVCGMKGVNVTLGLPFLRTSVDHGTAFDIARKNKASNEGLVSAIKLIEKIL